MVLVCKRVIPTIGVILLLGLIALSIAGLMLRSRVVTAVAATQRIVADTSHHDFRAGCVDLPPAAAAWQKVTAITGPLTPLLHRLAWVPRFGSDLRIAPEATILAMSGTAAGTSACAIANSALQDTAASDRLAVAAQSLSQQPAVLAQIVGDLQQAQVAWTGLAPHLDASQRLAPYRNQLQQLGNQLPSALRTLATVQQLSPELPWLLGLDAPRHYLAVLQDPFEIRATGGFLGMVCSVKVEHAKVTVESCRESETYAANATPDMPQPFQYHRYLHLTNYTLRDANWSPDFPTTARTIQAFWSLNGQPFVDGVIGADLYVLRPLLSGMGPVTMSDGTAINADQAVSTILARDYINASQGHDDLVGVAPVLMHHLQQTDLAALPAIAGALETALSERHLLVAMNRGPAAQVFAAQGWDGSIRPSSSNSLRVIDSDVGYGRVSAFVERLTHYDLTVDAQATPLTATVTLTYTNSFSPWADASNPYEVVGVCTDPQTLVSTPSLGCYADYVRLYIPNGIKIIGVRGFEETADFSTEVGRMIVGGYLRVPPGEERVVRLSYSLPHLTPGTLTIEKQAGTIAPPILLTVHTANHQVALYASGRTDATLPYTVTNSLPIIQGPADQAAAAIFASNSARDHGLAQWQANDQASAIKTWQAGNALDLVLDHARTLTPTDALPLMTAINAIMPGGRAAFEEATLRVAQGATTAAAPLFERAAAQSPENPLAQLTLAQQRAATGQPLPRLDTIPAWSSTVRRWRVAIDELEQTGVITDAVAHVAVLLQVTPHDRTLALRLADLRLRAGQRDIALAAYTTLAKGDDIVSRLAHASLAQVAGDHTTAQQLYVAALPLATTYPLACHIGNGLRDLGDVPHALQAYHKAGSLYPNRAWPFLAAGDMLRASNPAAARSEYQAAQRYTPTSGYPDYALGTLLLAQGDPTKARPLLEAALRKQPDQPDFKAALARLPPAR